MNSYNVIISGNERVVNIDNDGNIRINGKPANMTFEQVDGRTFSVLSEGNSYKTIAVKEEGVYRMLVNGNEIISHVESERMRLLKKFAISSEAEHARTEIRAPMPALVVKVEVDIGDDVREGQGLIVLEAMKMENEIRAHRKGRVSEIHIAKGRAVEKGELLMLLE